MNIHFENDFQQKIMQQAFAEPTALNTNTDVQQWRGAWMSALSSWHSPYKALIDCRNLTLSEDPEVKKALEIMLKFFSGFFLRKAVGYGFDSSKGHGLLPFTVHATAEDAAIDLGIRQPKQREATDFRSMIQLQNHFQQHTIELNFAEPVCIETTEQIKTLKSKLMNNLMQWHSKWNLLIDCTNVEIAPAMKDELAAMLKHLRGFFMKAVVGYSPKSAKDTYPFEVYRARHRAAALIEGEGNFSGDAADCKSRKA